MQAIQTKYIAPTNFRGTRVVARCCAGKITYSWDHRYDPEENHLAAANSLKIKLGWTDKNYGTLRGGQLPDGSYVWVMVKP